MENQEIKEQDTHAERNEWWKRVEKSHRRGKIMGGLLIVAIGSLFLARELGAAIPAWVLSWKMLLIGLGIVTAVKHKFRHPGWIILIGVGGAFLMNDLYPEMNIKPIIWPVVVIIVGLFIIFKPRRKFKHHMHRHWGRHRMHHEHYKQYMEKRFGKHNSEVQAYCDYGAQDYSAGINTNEDFIESTVVFAGVKKNVISKTFKGGEVTNVFGGSEINLMQADIEGTANLEVTQVFGGTTIIVPAHWDVKTEQMVTVLGNVEDKRPVNPNIGTEDRKTLRLIGTTVFGGIEIRSY